MCAEPYATYSLLYDSTAASGLNGDAELRIGATVRADVTIAYGRNLTPRIPCLHRVYHRRTMHVTGHDSHTTQLL